MALADAFEIINPNLHDLKGFCCGKPSMDDFLKRFAVNHMNLGISRTWCLPVTASSAPPKTPIAAYYTLSSCTVAKDGMPYKRSLPRHQLPVVLLARLAVAEPYKGQHLGAKTLVTALRKADELTTQGLPALGLVLDVLDEEAMSFYQHFELFEPFTDNPMRLFVPMTVLRKT